jgi:hypothetical protein
VGVVGLKTGFSSGLEAAFIATPLFQINLLPDLTQVYFTDLTVAVNPTLVHLLPGLTAAFEGVEPRDKTRKMARAKRNAFIT